MKAPSLSESTSEAPLEGSGPAASDRRSRPPARRRVLILASHVIQYSSPLFRRMAQDERLDLEIAYCSLQGAEPKVDPEFGVEVAWDTSLLDGYRWIRLPNRSPTPGLGRFFGLFNPGVWRLISGGGFDVVILPGYFYLTAWIALAAAKFSGTPIFFVTDSHGLQSWNTQSRWKLRVKSWLVRRIFRLGSAVLVSSTGGLEYLKSLGVSNDRSFLLPSAVDNDWWTCRASAVDRNRARAAWNIPAEASVALFCGKLQPWKAPGDLLRAFARIKVPNGYLILAGDGPERASLDRKASELGISERVRFPGFLNQSELPAAYCAADVFVLPSLFEPFGLVINEAMLCGLPVVVSDRVGARFDLVRHGENGYVYPAGNVDALAAILRDLLTDAEQGKRMGAASRRRMETWSPREYTEAMVQAIQIVATCATRP